MSNEIKITFIGAGSTVFARNVLGDCMCRPALCESEFALYDIDKTRLEESKTILEAMNKKINGGKAKIKTYLGVEKRKAALKNANFVVNAIQVGGYIPSTVIDFEIPKKYGLRQTIGDTLGIGGIFRALRTIPVMLDFGHEMEEVCPDAWLLNYTNPMAMLTGAMLKGTSVKTVGLCHSVQVCLSSLLRHLNLHDGSSEDLKGYTTKIAGINHMAWLLEVKKDGKDIYPELKKIAAKKVAEWRKCKDIKKKSGNIVRLDMMNKVGYYTTESSEHYAEYLPYYIKSAYPELIEEFNIPLDEYPRRCVCQIKEWKKEYSDIEKNLKNITHTMSHEYGSGIMNSIVTDTPYMIGGNVLNRGFITNLPSDAVVEVPCLVSRSGIAGTYVGALPPQCAAINMTNINVQLLATEAALTLKKEHIYHAAMLDPHTSSELPLDKIIALCDDLIEAHGDMLPKYK